MAKEEAMNSYVEELKKVLKERYPHGYDKQEVNNRVSSVVLKKDWV